MFFALSFVAMLELSSFSFLNLLLISYLSMPVSNHRMNLRKRKRQRVRSLLSSGIQIATIMSSSQPLESVPPSSRLELVDLTIPRSRMPSYQRHHLVRTEATFRQTHVPPRLSLGPLSKSTSPNLHPLPSPPTVANPNPSPSYAPTATYPPPNGIARVITSPPSPPKPARQPC